MEKKSTVELLALEMRVEIPYQWAAGAYIGEFLRELKDSGKIYANRCPKCGRFRCPPGPVCSVCHVAMEERNKWIAVGPSGTLLAFSVIEQSFLVATTGEMLQVPFSMGVVLLDGGSASLQHCLEETNADKIDTGMRVEAVFKPKELRQGNIFDIIHFRTIS